MMRLTLAAACLFTLPALAIDESHRSRAEEMIDRAVAYLRTQQDEAAGGWRHNPDPQRPNFPAITGLVLTGFLTDPDFDRTDPAVIRGARYILSYRQPDGGIYDRVLPTYNTAICLSALAHLDTPQAREAVGPALRMLRSLQYGEDAAESGEAGAQTLRVGPDHPFYGGVGYGSSGRPDNSNLHFFMQALEDAGVPHDDPAVQRALVFLARTQMEDSVNDQPYADDSSQGGFIYSTSLSKDEPGRGESKAPTLEETLDDGSVVSRLRAYGSMTYAGFKSYAYAQLAPDDPRVEAALKWITRNYTLEENPGVGTDGQYYYYLTFGKAMDAWGRRAGTPRTDSIDIITPRGSETRDWANDLIDQLATLQNEDGSFRSVDDRWMENDPVLITAYSLIALQHAVKN